MILCVHPVKKLDTLTFTSWLNVLPLWTDKGISFAQTMRANTATLVYSLARGFSNLQVKSGMNIGLTGTSALVGNKPDPHGMVMVYDLNGHISHQDETQRQKKNKSATAKPVLQYLTASAAFCMHVI